MRLGVASALVDGTFVGGDVYVDGGVIEAVGASPKGGVGVALPGFIDLQVNGFGGVDFASADPDGYGAAGSAMAATGVTAYQPTLITLPEQRYLTALAVVAEARHVLGPRIVGAHLEGPFLSQARHGAHDPANLREPDFDLMDRLLEAGPVSYVTLAPELPGALELIDRLRDHRIVVAIGHSDADAETANQAFDAGATGVTHLFNAQRPFSHRDPGISGAALARDDIVVTMIVDGIHLADETVLMATNAAANRYALITDAIAATGMPEAAYPLSDRRVVVSDGAARLEDGTLAGSVLTMDQAVRNLIDLGITVPNAVAAATSTPARLIGRPQLGALRPGARADIAVVDDDFSVIRTLVGGKEVAPG